MALVPATLDLARAEIEDRGEFARGLGATVPDNWPPETAADVLPLFLEWLAAASDQVGWFSWYALIRDAVVKPTASGEDRPVLGAGGGFLGPPEHGEIQIGYAVLPQFQRRGYATEMVGALVHWAFAQPSVLCIAAETEWANPASVRVLTKLGFAPNGPVARGEGTRFILRRGAEAHDREEPPTNRD